MKTIRFAATLIALGSLLGCATTTTGTYVHTADEMMKFPISEVHEVRTVVELPVGVAYRNILNRARICWSNPFVVDSDPYDADVGFAGIAMRMVSPPPGIWTAMEIRPLSPKSSAIVARTPIKLFAGATRGFLVISDLDRIKEIAEGKLTANSDGTFTTCKH